MKPADTVLHCRDETLEPLSMLLDDGGGTYERGDTSVAAGVTE